MKLFPNFYVIFGTRKVQTYQWEWILHTMFNHTKIASTIKIAVCTLDNLTLHELQTWNSSIFLIAFEYMFGIWYLTSDGSWETHIHQLNVSSLGWNYTIKMLAHFTNSVPRHFIVHHTFNEAAQTSYSVIHFKIILIQFFLELLVPVVVGLLFWD